MATDRFNMFKIYLMCLALLAVRVQAECPLGWYHFMRSCYYISHEKLNWFNAQGSCRGHNAKLVEITDSHTMDFLRYYLTDRFRDDISVTGAWTGGRDDIVEGLWQWSSTGAKLTYTDWAAGEPSSGSQYNCLELWKKPGWQFDDTLCTEQLVFICESEIPETEIVG